MGKDIFAPALDKLSNEAFGIFGPTSFQDYLKSNNLPKSDTPASISIDSFERLPSTLKNNHAMVFRLGKAPHGTGTQFALVKAKDKIREFFLMDEEIFTDKIGSIFLPAASMRQLFAYQITTNLSETSIVNLGLASGLISYSLGLDDTKMLPAPATCRKTFTFDLKLHSNLEKGVTHYNGQVEIDALFVEKRQNKETLFILEAKTNDFDKSLAKHKLVYPILALAGSIPKDMPIIPVYVRVNKFPDGLHFHVVECDYPNSTKTPRSIDELRFKKHSHLILPKFSI